MIAAVAISVLLSTGAPSQSVMLPPELTRVLTDYETFWRRAEGAALVGLFDDDGFVLPNGEPMWGNSR